MSKLALYQKYRSSTFEEVVGQEYIVRSIKNAVRTGKIGHAYLFCGPRGTGKTTMARILAKSVNCQDTANAPCEKCPDCIAANNGTHPDIIEINAANETHVEDIRDLIERAKLSPMQGHHKIYIIDEVHQLSSAASSALLKTLEEPPEHVIFVLATTDPQKLLPTIISRCQRYDFSRVNKVQITDHLLNIAEKENIQMDRKAAEMIAVLSEGGMRDALSIMDQCAAYTSDHITIEDIENIYGLSTTDEKLKLAESMLACNLEDMLARISEYDEKGIDLARYTDGLIDIFKDGVIYSYTKNAKILKLLTAEQAEYLLGITDAENCMRLAEKFIAAKEFYKNASSLTNAFEVTCLSAAVESTNKTVIPAKPAAVVQEKPAEKKETIPEPAVQTEFEDPEPEPEPVIPVVQQRELPEDEILSILVQCNKTCKQVDEPLYGTVNMIASAEDMKYTTLLKQARLGASGEDVLLLVTAESSAANRINDQKMNEELYFFIKKRLGIDKMIFAITESAFRSASREFMKKMKAGELPEKKQITRYAENEVKVKSTEDKVMDLFGKENVEIIGG
ncbi:MAG: DNA polymerase III subunit gamma/tau [Solobacterium sp.]|nr:DNA polymerase III subunit gamma/tau [Solobacterium sp.]